MLALNPPGVGLSVASVGGYGDVSRATSGGDWRLFAPTCLSSAYYAS